jgi:hypothetical protein
MVVWTQQGTYECGQVPAIPIVSQIVNRYQHPQVMNISQVVTGERAATYEALCLWKTIFIVRTTKEVYQTFRT